MRQQSFRHHVLALALVSDSFAATVNSLIQPKYFEGAAEQHICRFILEHYREYNSPPKRMALHSRAHEYFNASKSMKDVAEEFDELLDKICDLETEAAEQQSYILDKVVGFCQEESMKEALLNSVDDIKAHKFEEVTVRIQKAMSVGAELDGNGVFLLKESDTRQTVQQARVIVPTGHVWVDDALRGGLGKRELTMYMAPPNAGKSTIGINIGTGACKKGNKVAHFTLEMSKELTRAKYDQCLLGQTDAQLEALDPAGRNAIANWMKKMGKNLGADIYIKEFPAHKLTPQMLRAHLMLLKSRYNFTPDLCVIDYMDLMAMPTHLKEEHQQLNYLCVDVRALMMEMNMAGVTFTQTNRGGANKETAFGDDIAGAFAKVATVDALFSFNQTKAEAELDEGRIMTAKNRVGRRFGSYKVHTDFERSLIQPA